MMARKPKHEPEVSAAKKPRNAKGASAPKASSSKGATVTETIKMIPAKKLASLLGDARKATQEGRSIAGELGAAIKEAAENDHLHKKAFASVRASDRMEPEALADYFAHRDYYEESLGLRKRAGSVMRMPLAGSAEASAAEQGNPEDRTATVHRFPGQAAE